MPAEFQPWLTGRQRGRIPPWSLWDVSPVSVHNRIYASHIPGATIHVQDLFMHIDILMLDIPISLYTLRRCTLILDTLILYTLLFCTLIGALILYTLVLFHHSRCLRQGGFLLAGVFLFPQPPTLKSSRMCRTLLQTT